MDRSEGALRFKIAMWSMPGVILGLVAGLAAGRPGLAVVLAARMTLPRDGRVSVRGGRVHGGQGR